MSTANPNPFGTQSAPVAPPATSSAGSQTPARPDNAVALIIAALLGLVLGALGTMLYGQLTSLPPTALAAQSGKGTILTAPTGCQTGDKIYQANINGEEGKEVKDGKLVPGSERVLVKGVFATNGHAENVSVEVNARESKVKPVLDAIYVWSPKAANPGDPLEHQVMRYAVPKGANKILLEDTKMTMGKDTTVFACVAAEPR